MSIILMPTKDDTSYDLLVESGRMCVQGVINSKFRKKNEWMRSIESFKNHTMSLSTPLVWILWLPKGIPKSLIPSTLPSPQHTLKVALPTTF